MAAEYAFIAVVFLVILKLIVCCIRIRMRINNEEIEALIAARTRVSVIEYGAIDVSSQSSQFRSFIVRPGSSAHSAVIRQPSSNAVPTPSSLPDYSEVFSSDSSSINGSNYLKEDPPPSYEAAKSLLQDGAVLDIE